MNDDRVRDLMKGFGDPVVPAPDERAAREARSRALPRIEASLRDVALGKARRSRTRRLALLFGVAAVLVLGVASAAVLSSRASSQPSPTPSEIAPPSVVAPAPASVSAPAPEVKDDPPKRDDAPPEVAPPPRSARVDVRATKPPEASTLSDQNRLLAAALEARTRNDDARALAHLNELLQKYPSSPLAEEARIERVRCLERLARARKPKP